MITKGCHPRIGRAVYEVGLLCLAAAAYAAGCSTAPNSATWEDTATEGAEVRVGRTTQINQLNYTLTGPGGFSRVGSLNVSRTREVEASIKEVPAGTPYTLSLNGSSTDGNVTCTGSKSGIAVTCPARREQNDTFIKLTCTRNHLGKEWGDRDWRSNAKTFFLGAEILLFCPTSDGGADSGAVDGASSLDGAVDAGSCVPRTCAQAGASCGTIADGCGGGVSCGDCPPGLSCNGQNQCVCVPATTCPPGQTAGTAPDGCGGMILCGVCPPGIPPQNHCGTITCLCQPRTFCSSDVNCGVQPDGCGCTLNCGTCPSGSTCQIPDGGTAGTCSPTGCDFRSGNTAACIQSRDGLEASRCSRCVNDNGCFDPAQLGGTCESLIGTAPASCAAVLGTASAPSEKQVCLATLDRIFQSSCATTLLMAPCLCGATSATACLDGSAAPTGPLLPLYQCDLGSDIDSIVTNFTVPTFGAGLANAIVSCAAAYGCNCF
jgi:hypothetical protein